MTDKEWGKRLARWSLRLTMALDDEDWEGVSAVCGEINAIYRDLAYGKEGE